MTLWKPIPIPFIPNRYRASDDGQIMTVDYETSGRSRAGRIYPKYMKSRVLSQRICKATPSGGIHPVVGIYTGTGRGDWKNTPQRVARLVAAAFYGVPYDPTEQSDIQKWRLRFIDGDPLNTHAINLEWTHNFGQDGSGSSAINRYGRNLDGFRATDFDATMSRLFGAAA